MTLVDYGLVSKGIKTHGSNGLFIFPGPCSTCCVFRICLVQNPSEFLFIYNEAKMKFFCKYKCSHDKLRGFLAVKVIIFSVP